MNQMSWEKSRLIPGEYYAGRCRNATVARWDGKKFWYWRVKFGSRFLESIHHPDDDQTFDVFTVKAWVHEREVIEIPLKNGLYE